jgi:putative ABC transport system permease protein
MRRLLRSWLWRIPVEQEVDEEIAFHVEMRTRAFIAQGKDPRTARRLAMEHLGDVTRLKRTCVHIGRKRDREMRMTQRLQDVGSDVRFAVRQLKSSPGFALVAIVTLALGIGANSAMFALADATVLRPLPYPEPDRLVMVWERSPSAGRAPVGPVNLRDVQERNRSFESTATIASNLGGGPLLEGPDGRGESVERQFVSAKFFDVLGVTPVAGRTFLSADEGPAPTAVVLSEGLWRTRFGSDPTLIGRQVRLNGRPQTVVGVVSDRVKFSRPASIWSLLPPLPAGFNQRGLRFLEVVGRLKRDVTFESAQADVSVIAGQLAREYPGTNKDWGITLEPLRTGIMGPKLQLTSMLLLGVVGFVLLMCCANVANLLLVRASVRARELAVRSALGAGRARIVGQLLTESLTLAFLGGVLGVGIGAAIMKMAPALIPPGLLPAAVMLTFDGRVVVFCAVTALAVGLSFGLLPAWQATSTSLVQAIASDSRSATRGGGRVRNVLAAGQVAAAVLLLCGAGLLLRTLLVLGHADSGYRAGSDTVLTLDFSVSNARYPTPRQMLQFYDTVGRDVSVLPNVRDVGWASSLPWGTSELGRWAFEIAGDPPIGAASRPTAEYTIADEGYFRTLDIPIVAGRGFTGRDSRDALPVCIVNEAFVRRHLHGRDPIGVRVSIRPSFFTDGVTPAMREIVGVARQVKGQADEPEDLLQVYVPLAQVPYADVFLVVQSIAGSPGVLAPAIRAAVARHDPNVPVRRIRTLGDLADESTAPYRFRAVLVATFAGLALLVALVGVFGVLAYSVEQRSREFGVRIALGASTGHVLRLVLGSAARVILSGALIGLALSAALSRSLATFLFGVQPLDPVTYAAVATVLGLTAVLATLAPALRAARVDPVVTFRNI